jgi:hypothetical protein
MRSALVRAPGSLLPANVGLQAARRDPGPLAVPLRAAVCIGRESQGESQGSLGRGRGRVALWQIQVQVGALHGGPGILACNEPGPCPVRAGSKQAAAPAQSPVGTGTRPGGSVLWRRMERHREQYRDVPARGLRPGHWQLGADAGSGRGRSHGGACQCCPEAIISLRSAFSEVSTDRG